MKRRLTAALICLALLCAFLPGTALATEYGDFDVTVTGTGDTPAIYLGVLMLGSGTYTVAMRSGVTQTSNLIIIVPGKTANLTLSGVHIEAGDNSALDVSGATLNLVLDGVNELNNHDTNPPRTHAAVHVPAGSTLNISAKTGLADALTVGTTGSTLGAGIGGNGMVSSSAESCGTVNISGGTVKIVHIGSSFTHSAGIGGGCSQGGNGTSGGNGGNVTISGNAHVTATGGVGAGIGGGTGSNGGNGGSGGTVNISGSAVVKAESFQGPGIGGGNGSSNGGAGAAVTVSGSAHVTATGSSYSAGIGGGGGGSGGSSGPGGSGGTVTVSENAVVTATGGEAGVGIGGGYSGTSAGGDGAAVTVSGNAVVTAAAGPGTTYESGVGIGGGNGRLTHGACGTLEITGGTVTAAGGNNRRAIGVGPGGPDTGSIRIVPTAGKAFTTRVSTSAVTDWNTVSPHAFTVNPQSYNFKADTVAYDSRFVQIRESAAPALTVGANPAGSVRIGTAVTLTATPANLPGSNPGYQWYSNTTDSTAGGAPVGGATNATYRPSTAAAGTTYYYCKANDMVTVDSNVVAVTVTAASVPAPASVPKTGDSTPLVPLALLALLSGAGLTASRILRRRKAR